MLDLQNGFERALNAVIPALAGADELSGIGEMEAGSLSTFAQMVADNRITSYNVCYTKLLRFVGGVMGIVAGFYGGSYNFV